MSIISQPYFWDEQAAHAKLENIVWPNGPVCRRCGATDRIGAVTGKGARAGLKFCCRCRKQFRATIGTIFEGSHVPLHKWFQACFILSVAGTAVTAYQLHLRLEVTNKTALGIIQRLTGLIKSAERNPHRAEPDWQYRAQTVGRLEPAPRRNRIAERSASVTAKQSCRRPARAPIAIGWDQLPWMQFPTPPRRQFLRFVETVRELGCVEDEGIFDQMLAEMGTYPARPTRVKGGLPSTVPTALSFPGPARNDLVPAAA